MKFFNIIEILRNELQKEFDPLFVRICFETGWDNAPEESKIKICLIDMKDYQITGNFNKSKNILIDVNLKVFEDMNKNIDELFQYIKLAIEFQMIQKEGKKN